MLKTRLDRPALEVRSRGYQQLKDIEAETTRLACRVKDPDNSNRNRDAKALGTLNFHMKVLRATMEALGPADDVE